MTLDEMLQRGDIAEFQKYVLLCPYHELTVLWPRAVQINKRFGDAVFAAMITRKEKA
jgi:hypothetical protein